MDRAPLRRVSSRKVKTPAASQLPPVSSEENGKTTVDLGAPGSGIYSTLPGKRGRSSYGSYSGTSMATPHVTGAVALYAASHPAASVDQIKAAILSSTVPTASLQGITATGGRLNVSGF